MPARFANRVPASDMARPVLPVPVMNPETTPNPTPTKSDLRAEIEDLRRLADTMRLRIHLAGLEVRQAWRKLEPRIEAAQRLAQAELAALGEEVGGDVSDAIAIVKRMTVDLSRRLATRRPRRR